MNALLRWISAPVLLSLTLTGMAAEYDYPFDDPFVVTVVGTPADWHVQFEQPAPIKHLGIPPLAERPVPEVFWYQDQVSLPPGWNSL